MTYSEKLRDPRWQKKRLEILTRDNWACQSCFNTRETLHVHHMIYPENTEPWDCDERLLITVCESCHSVLHSKDEAAKMFVFIKLWFSSWLMKELNG